jgi:hypothetical protein
MDQDAGGLLDVAMLTDDAAVRASVLELLPPEATVRWHTVEHSLADLREVALTRAGARRDRRWAEWHPTARR